MNLTEAEQDGAQDHGQVVKSRSALLSWTWLFPLLASAVAIWFFWENWKSEGPRIEIRFASAPGIQADKTVLTFRGVVAGKVTDVTLDPALNDVVVHVRLNSFAKGLARANTDFWIDQPEISLKGATGITALIQGNSIQARVRGGAYATHFHGLEKPPLVTTENPGLVAYLKAPSISFVDRGAPIYYHGTLVGMVGDKKVEENGESTLMVGFKAEAAHWVKSTSRFWMLPATSLNLSPRGAQVNIAGLKTLIEGGITFDEFSPDGQEVTNGSVFTIAPNEAAARADGPPLQLRLQEGRGLIPGETRVCYLGQPIGLVESVHPDPATESVEATIRLETAFTNFARSDTSFTLVSPAITPHGVSGLDTLVTGAYIACEPGKTGLPTNAFACATVSGETPGEGLRLFLSASEIPSLSKDSPVYYRGLKAGRVLSSGLDAEGRPRLELHIDQAFRDAVRANTRFWRVPATSVDVASGVLSVRMEGLSALIDGGIAFDTFTAPGEPAVSAASFTLYHDEKLAAATSSPIHILFENGRGLLAGRTQLRYLGLPVGIVESVTPREDGKVETVVRLEPGYDFLRREGSVFFLARPTVFLNGGVKGMETIMSGIYIECVKGEGGYADTFQGRTDADAQLLDTGGFPVRLTTASTSITPGAMVVYRGVRVGEVSSKAVAKDGKSVLLTLDIRSEYRHLVQQNSLFWDGSEAFVKIGFLKLRIKAPLLSSLNGQVFFTNPSTDGAPVGPEHTFPLRHEVPDQLTP